eukprot:scaffold112784_cov43-Prasinocladus_malaysianus.AAC.1
MIETTIALFFLADFRHALSAGSAVLQSAAAVTAALHQCPMRYEHGTVRTSTVPVANSRDDGRLSAPS